MFKELLVFKITKKDPKKKHLSRNWHLFGVFIVSTWISWREIKNGLQNQQISFLSLLIVLL